MKNIKLQLTEFCPKCRNVQNVKGTSVIRIEEDSTGAKKSIITVSYHCGVCSSFVRSEEHEVTEK